ncbi:MAG: prepilin-type N-terminal cleavage/methylation domain-containing protein [Planctomycetes bacterium]|nr:prepilin-type N-terminal cleavage/methylation domain-containing protein [Planctomycetota bacterium]MBL7008571.1 prepilin-type N-terminal cleavage/methylation domain-containing protein [Planctomycetota bacterium]
MRRSRARRSDRGFTLPELLVLIALISLVSLWGLPRALEPRLRLNQDAAVDLLRMLASSRTEWQGRTGVPVTLPQLASFLYGEEEAGMPRGLMPRGFVIRTDGVVLRGGYRFREVVDLERGPLGCWAWPKLPGYSGRQVYWLDYRSGEVGTVAPVLALPPPAQAPAAADLAPG